MSNEWHKHARGGDTFRYNGARFFVTVPFDGNEFRARRVDGYGIEGRFVTQEAHERITGSRVYWIDDCTPDATRGPDGEVLGQRGENERIVRLTSALRDIVLAQDDPSEDVQSIAWRAREALWAEEAAQKAAEAAARDQADTEVSMIEAMVRAVESKRRAEEFLTSCADDAVLYPAERLRDALVACLAEEQSKRECEPSMVLFAFLLIAADIMAQSNIDRTDAGMIVSLMVGKLSQRPAEKEAQS